MVMRQVFFVLSILLISLSMHASQSIKEGSWYNPYLQRNIFISHHRDGVRIKGIHSRYGWTWFERCGKNTFRDRYENTVKFTGSSRMIYFKQNRRARLTFYPVTDRYYDRYGERPGGTYRNYGDDDWYSEHDRTDYKYEESQNDVEGRGSALTSRKHRNLISPEGTWQSRELNRNVYIIDTRDGLKARFSDEHDWYIFKSDDKNKGVFYSEKGHRYEYIDENNMLWIDSSGQRKYKLIKISEEIK
jgi:hypothetical protein